MPETWRDTGHKAPYARCQQVVLVLCEQAVALVGVLLELPRVSLLYAMTGGTGENDHFSSTHALMLAMEVRLPGALRAQLGSRITSLLDSLAMTRQVWKAT